MKILIVDDENAILRGVSKIIQENTQYQFEIELASDSMQAMRKLDQFHADLVITDICMPIMSGLELIEKATASHLCGHFIILTGHEDFNYARQAIKFKVEEYIVKPINKRELMQAILRIADNIHMSNPDIGSVQFDGFDDIHEKIQAASSTTKKIISYINSNYSRQIFLGKLSQELDINEKYLCSLMMKELGVTFLQYLDYIRLKNAAILLLNTNKTVIEISQLTGFSSERQMFNVFKRRVSMTPSQFKGKYQKVI